MKGGEIINSLIAELNVNNIKVRIMRVGNVNYIFLADLVKYKNYETSVDAIKKRKGNGETIEFLGLW